MYSIRYLIKKEGSQIAFWDRNVNYDADNTMWLADQFVESTKSQPIMNSGWIKEDTNFWRKKIVFAAGSPEETNFAIHINVGLESDSYKSNL
jgi:hypothetical protein